MRGAVLFHIFLALALLGFPSAVPVERDTEKDRSERIEQARQRWESMTDEERSNLVKRFEDFSEMSTEERAQLRERLRDLTDRRQRVESGLGADDRSQLDGAAPRARRRAMRELLVSRSRERGLRLRGKLPPALLEKLRSATPRERHRLLKEFREKRFARGYRKLVKAYGEALGIEREERDQLLRLPREECRDALLGLERKFTRARVAEIGLPDGTDAEEWADWEKLSDREFFARWRRLQPSSEYHPPFVGAHVLGPPGNAKQGHGGSRTERARAWRRIREACHPTVAELLAIEHLPPRERRAITGRRVRERVELAIREAGLLDEAALAALAQMGDREFLDRLYQNTRDRSAGAETH